MRKLSLKSSYFTLFVATVVFCGAYGALACSRLMYEGLDGIVMTARTMDWNGDMPTSLWIMPRNRIVKDQDKLNIVEWKSKYGSVTTEAFGLTSDGMNEAGLVANMLWYEGSSFDKSRKTNMRRLPSGLWMQYLLDNFASVAEAVNAMEKRNFDIVSMFMPGKDYM